MSPDFDMLGWFALMACRMIAFARFCSEQVIKLCICRHCKQLLGKLALDHSLKSALVLHRLQKIYCYAVEATL